MTFLIWDTGFILLPIPLRNRGPERCPGEEEGLWVLTILWRETDLSYGGLGVGWGPGVGVEMSLAWVCGGGGGRL